MKQRLSSCPALVLARNFAVAQSRRGRHRAPRYHSRERVAPRWHTSMKHHQRPAVRWSNPLRAHRGTRESLRNSTTLAPVHRLPAVKTPTPTGRSTAWTMIPGFEEEDRSPIARTTRKLEAHVGTHTKPVGNDYDPHPWLSIAPDASGELDPDPTCFLDFSPLTTS